MTYFENGVNSAECQGVETQTVLSRGLLAEESMLSWGPSRSRAYGFALEVVALFFFFFYSQGLDCYNSSLCSWSAGY